MKITERFIVMRRISFWTGWFIPVIPFLFALYYYSINLFLILGIMVIYLIAYFIFDSSKLLKELKIQREEKNIEEQKSLIKEYLKKQINLKLSCVDLLHSIDTNQCLRSNIFVYYKNSEHYTMKYKYNMEEWPDKTIKIPVNRGCTGDAWNEKTQIFRTRDIFIDKDKTSGVPQEELNKVPNDLEWICSTPIFDNNNVLAVLNFDGNKEMTEQDKEKIKVHARRVASELSNDLILLNKFINNII